MSTLRWTRVAVICLLLVGCGDDEGVEMRSSALLIESEGEGVGDLDAERPVAGSPAGSVVYLGLVEPERLDPDPRISFNLGKLFFNAGNPEAAAFHLDSSLEHLAPALAVKAGRLLARAMRKQGKAWPQLAAMWQRAASASPESPVPRVELSKLYEWKARDPQRALGHARRALALDPDPKVEARAARLAAKTGARPQNRPHPECE